MFTKILIYLSLSAGFVYAHITKDAAVQRCTTTTEFLESSMKTSEFNDLVVQSFFSVFITKVKNILQELKKAEDPKVIFELRRSCDSSQKTAKWLFENFAYVDKKQDPANELTSQAQSKDKTNHADTVAHVPDDRQASTKAAEKPQSNSK